VHSLAGLALLVGSASGPIDWSAPLECPSERVVNEQARDLADDPIAFEHASFGAVVVRSGGRFRARVRALDDASAKYRDFADESCETVADAVALFVAVSTDGQAARVPIERRRHRVKLGLGAAVGAEWGALPGLTGGVRPSFSIAYGAFAAELRGDYWIPRRADRDEVEVAIDAGMAGALACGVPEWGRVQLPICGGAEIGVLRARPRGLDRDDTRLRTWAAVVASVRVRVRIAPRVALTAGPELAVPFLRPGFTVVDDEGVSSAIHLANPVSVRAHVGFEFWLQPSRK
jgi:hypothetical protein